MSTNNSTPIPIAPISINIPPHEDDDAAPDNHADVHFAPMSGGSEIDSEAVLPKEATSTKPKKWITHHLELMQKNWVGDSLFVLQVACCLTFGLGQFISLLTSDSEGVSITWYGFWILFLVVNLGLSFQSHKVAPSRGTAQTLWIYCLWTAVLLLDILAIIFRGSIRWTPRDTFTTVASFVFLALSFSYGMKKRKLSITDCFRDPIIKGLAAVGFKAIPQCVLAYNVFVEGADGFNTFSVISGHFTLIARIVQLYITIRQTSWELNRTATFVSEVANETSWLVATIAILVVKGR